MGTPAKVIRMLGNKKIARSTMIAAGVPVVPGSEGDVEDIETGLKAVSYTHLDVYKRQHFMNLKSRM